mmetsp:Transcript_35096/g.76073  ORF Transcript_35096/g.76073 Transcript_35096/m.76073 type:complete len:343 (+) Transcript_35096:509-1537(+)
MNQRLRGHNGEVVEYLRRVRLDLRPDLQHDLLAYADVVNLQALAGHKLFVAALSRKAVVPSPDERAAIFAFHDVVGNDRGALAAGPEGRVHVRRHRHQRRHLVLGQPVALVYRKTDFPEIFHQNSRSALDQRRRVDERHAHFGLLLLEDGDDFRVEAVLAPVGVRLVGHDLKALLVGPSDLENQALGQVRRTRFVLVGERDAKGFRKEAEALPDGLGREVVDEDVLAGRAVRGEGGRDPVAGQEGQGVALLPLGREGLVLLSDLQVAGEALLPSDHAVHQRAGLSHAKGRRRIRGGDLLLSSALHGPQARQHRPHARPSRRGRGRRLRLPRLGREVEQVPLL